MFNPLIVESLNFFNFSDLYFLLIWFVHFHNTLEQLDSVIYYSNTKIMFVLAKFCTCSTNSYKFELRVFPKVFRTLQSQRRTNTNQNIERESTFIRVQRDNGRSGNRQRQTQTQALECIRAVNCEPEPASQPASKQQQQPTARRTNPTKNKNTKQQQQQQ